MSHPTYSNETEGFHPDAYVGTDVADLFNEPVEHINWPKVICSIIICSIGLFGNTLVIFRIVFLRSYQRSVTHWYVLQLAIAYSLFLLTLTFKTSEDLNNRWIYGDWLCKAKETILFLNYYASMMFLMIMSADRYIAVCHTFSDALQKLRKPRSAIIITIATWILSLCMCMPITMHSAIVGIHPYCSCSYVFPSEMDNKNHTEICLEQGFEEDLELCLQMITPGEGGSEHCRALSDVTRNILNIISQPDFYVPEYYNNDGGDEFKPLHMENMSKSSMDDVAFEFSKGLFVDSQGEKQPIVDMDGVPMICTYASAPFGWKAFMVFNFVVMYALPVIVMITFYGLIVNHLHSFKFVTNTANSEDGLGSDEGRQRLNKKQRDKQRRRMTITCVALVSVFALLWLPFHINHMLKLVGINVPMTKVYICENLPVAGSLLAYLNSALHPYLYSFLCGNFKWRWRTPQHEIKNEGTSCISVTVMIEVHRTKSQNGGGLNTAEIPKENKDTRNEITAEASEQI